PTPKAPITLTVMLPVASTEPANTNAAATAAKAVIRRLIRDSSVPGSTGLVCPSTDRLTAASQLDLCGSLVGPSCRECSRGRGADAVSELREGRLGGDRARRRVVAC